ncbi:MAG: hypothetical protein ABIH67_00660 [Candidatus Uhrbacteria bacterium]
MFKKEMIKQLAKTNRSAKEILNRFYDCLMEPRLAGPPATWGWFAVGDGLWYEMLHDQERWRAKQQREFLIKQKFLEKKEQGDEAIYQLTETGQAFLLQEQISQIKTKYPAGLECYVFFDIPEPARDTRELFRRILKKCNFKLLQQSVWSSKNVVDELMSELVEVSGLSKWVKVMLGKEKTATQKRSRQSVV